MKAYRWEILLCGTGWLIAALSIGMRSLTLMQIACFSLGLVGAVRIGKLILDRDHNWSICALIAGASMPSYFIGAAITLAQYDTEMASELLPGGDHFLGNAMVAILYISLFYWVLIGMAAIENGYWQDSLRMLSSPAARQDNPRARPIIGAAMLALTAAQLYLISTGAVTLGGIDNSQDSRLPVGAVLAIDFAAPILAISAWVIGRWQKPLGLAYIAILSSACQVLWMGGLGRRVIFYGAVVFLSIFFWARGKRKDSRVLYLAIPMLGLVYLFTKLFVAMRYASYTNGDGGTQSLTTLYSEAFSLLSTDSDAIADAEKENYTSRFFILGNLTTVMSGLTFNLAQFGKFLFIALLTCIPSAFFPGKTEMMAKLDWGADGKALLNDILSLPQLDTAWTPMVAAYADFMWLGAFFYPVLFMAIGWMFSRIVKNIRYPPLVIAAFGLCYTAFVSTEVGISAYILTGRTLLFMWLIDKIIGFFDQPAVR